MSALRTALIAVAIAAAAAAAAQGRRPRGPQPDWQKDWDKALEEARERKVPLLVVIPKRQGSGGPIYYPKQLSDKTVYALTQNFVCLIADDARFPEIEKRIAVEYHKGKFGMYGQKLQFVFCKPDGTELEDCHLAGDISVAELTRTMQKVLRMYPKAISRTKFLKCRSLRARAEIYRKELIFSKAIELYRDLAKEKVDLEMVKEAEDMPEKLLQELKEKLAETEKLASGGADDKREAVRRLVALKVGCERERELKEYYEKAKSLLDGLKTDPDVSPTARKANMWERALKQYLKAEERFHKGDLKKALSAYKKILKNYRDTDYADRAKQRMKEIELRLQKEREQKGK